MTRYIALLAFVCLCSFSFAQTNNAVKSKLSEGAKFLFKNIKTKTTEAEKNFIYQKLQVKQSKDKKSLELEGFPVEFQVYPTDLNKDGMEEIFVTLSSAALFGNVGSTVLFFIKDKSGKYQQQTEVIGGIPMLMSSKNMGYPDILIGGPGMEYPSFRWNGKDYRYYKPVKDGSAESTNSTDVSVSSKTYTDVLK